MPILDVKDAFDGGGGDLQGRVPDQVAGAGYAWSAPLIGGQFQEMGGYIERTGSLSSHLVGNPRTPNYRVVAEVYFPGYGGIYARALNFSNYYVFEIFTGGNWRLGKKVSGTETQLASGSGSANFAGAIELEVVGSQVSAWRGGVLLASVADSALASKGQAGILSGGANLVQFHSFETRDYINPIRSVT